MKTKIINLFLTCCMSMLVGIDGRVFAQDSRDFYKKNYAESIYEKQTFEDEKNAETPGADNTKTSPAPANPSPEASKNRSNEEVPEVKSMMETRGERIRSFSLIVNSQQQEHFEKALDQLIDIASQGDVDIDNLYSISGGAPFVGKYPAKLMKKLWIMNGTVVPSDVVPEKYRRISLSPTWIVGTDKGEVLIEAPDVLEDFVTRKGYLIEREEKL